MALDNQQLQQVNIWLRRQILIMTSAAQSGHPTSALSAVELMSTLMYGGFFHAKLDEPEFINNDRLIFSKGHASPLLYALYSAIGKISEVELKTFRSFDSMLEGHPSMRFPYTEAATGSLGQGLSVGVGMALNAKLDKLPYNTFVLLGDSEFSEGQNYEALQIASHYQLDNLIGILDVNRLGQTGQTMLGHGLDVYERRIESFGWRTIRIDGHDIEEINEAYGEAIRNVAQPTMIIAKTLKGKGVAVWEDKEDWHSKQLSLEQLPQRLKDLGDVSLPDGISLEIPETVDIVKPLDDQNVHNVHFEDRPISTKEAVGLAVKQLGVNEQVVVLDGEVSNSTHSELFAKAFPERFFQMFIAEQNMVSSALGFSRCGKIPFVFTFSAFFSRAFDQIRMSQYSIPNIKFIGSYAGVSLGKDGFSQMGLEDIAMFRSIQDCLVFQPADAVSTQSLTQLAATHKGNVYVRTFREPKPVLYAPETIFEVGSCYVHGKSDHDNVAIIASGITVYEALKAQMELKAEGILASVIDLYCIAPINRNILISSLGNVMHVIVVEDHYQAGGVYEAVKTTLGNIEYKMYSMCVKKMPRSGTPAELLAYEEIDAQSIKAMVESLSG